MSVWRLRLKPRAARSNSSTRLVKNNAGVAAKMFEAMAAENINILMISTSEIKISCVVDDKYGELAVRVLHDAFGLDQPPLKKK